MVWPEEEGTRGFGKSMNQSKVHSLRPMPLLGDATCGLLRKFFLVLCFALLSGAVRGQAQTSQNLSQVKKIFVGKFRDGQELTELRNRTIQQLRKNAKLEVVEDAKEADATLEGSGSIWIVGYVSTDPRVPANARQAVFRGYLSAEIIGRNNEPMWSYLVTPSKFRSGPITQDLADRLVAKLIEDRRENSVVVATTAPAARARTVETTLSAAGATFPAPLYLKWFETFHEHDANVHIKYGAVGSEAGLRLLAGNQVDFAASDIPLSDKQLSESKTKLLHFPTVLGAVVPIYNVKGAERTLRFTGEALAGIYLGKIKKWNDPILRDSNKNVQLPDADIVVVHRSDGSGTTFVWTDYLSKISAEWKTSVGADAVVKWPVGVGAEANEGVAAKVQQTPNSIGYVELVYALRRQLNFGAVRNAASDFVQADLTSLAASARNATSAMTSDFRVSITNASGKNAYPISTFTWWIVPAGFGESEKKAAFLELLQWVLTSGQKECSALGYAPLPRETATRELEFLNSLK
jgi:phosphate ABC transporter phosphate-binding protein